MNNQSIHKRSKLAVGPKLRLLLNLVFFAFALLMINSIYLTIITFSEWLLEKSLQDQVYLNMFLLHLVLGLIIIIPLIIYGFIHISNTKNRRNRRAIKAGYVLFIASILLLITGLLLTRGIPVIEIKNTQARDITYWLHVILPLVTIWLFVMHRLAGPKFTLKPMYWTLFITILSLAGLAYLQKDTFNPKLLEHAEINPLFAPSFSQTSTNKHIPAKDLDNNEYCQECHQDIHEGWMNSVHKISSFNNASYAFAVNNTREFLDKRDGNHNQARFCATCHDPVIMFSGEFDKDKDFTDTEIGNAGITCTTCHAISNINSVKGNGAYTLTIPKQYPFTYSDNSFLKWTNRTLVKAKPDFHKASYLKPLHSTPEFCSTCHKVSIPEEFNGYKWLRGQNHYDAFNLSGVSGHAVAGFYYPPQAKTNCNSCHMPFQKSNDFGAITTSLTDEPKVHSHYFEAANSGIRQLNNLKPDPNNNLLENSLKVDIFGIKEDGDITGKLLAPVNDNNIEIAAGKKYLLETVIRTLTLGHAFTQGTGDSNQVWIELNVYNDGKLIGQSGGIDKDGIVDDWSYFINVYVLDNQGNRIDRRNVENIFTPLYNHSIPPGAATTVHFGLDVPQEITGELSVEVQVLYRKFDTNYYRLFSDDATKLNDLPIVTLGKSTSTITIVETPNNENLELGDWKNWYDYGIGLLRSKSYKQAEEIFLQVANMGRGEGWINLTRSYLQQGLIDQAQVALNKASEIKDFRYTWQLAYFAGVINLQNGFLDKAMNNFEQVYRTEFENARKANFDFSKDYKFVTMYAQTAYQRSKQLSGTEQQQAQQKSLELFQDVLSQDSEWADAHFGLQQLYASMGDTENSQKHKKLHQKYKEDNNVKDSVIALARSKNKAADHAAEAIAIYELNVSNTYTTVKDYILKNKISVE
jgi:tetratricopeptide (TPR) repeat protein